MIVVHDEPLEKSTPEVKEEVLNESIEGEALTGVEGEPAVEGEGSPDDTDGSVDNDESVDNEATDEPLDLKFEGEAVEVDIPDDLRDTFKEKGIDINEIVSDLYGGDEFGLSEDNINKLSEIYGKSLVTGYIAAIKSQNELAKSQVNDIKQAHEQENTSRWDAALEQVGGEEGWAGLEGWAAKSLSDEEFSDFNSVMESGSKYAQKLAISDMMSRHNKSEGDLSANIIEGENGGRGDSEIMLSSAEYLELFKSGEYSKNPVHYDAMRRLGQSKGI